MFLPYRTTTPFYYFPWCTIALIALNVVVYGWMETAADDDTIIAMVLHYGDGLKPLQWLTSNFIHGSVGHLFGNMVFLWVFGQITEGRTGWKVFVPVYLGIGVLQCAIEQTIMLGADGGASFGASSIIFGLMVMSLIWVPGHDIYIFYFFWIIAFIRFGTFPVSIKTMALFCVAKEILFAYLWLEVHGGMSSQLLHLSGAALGFAAAVLLLKKNLVEHEDEDIFSARKKKLKKMRGEDTDDAPSSDPITADDQEAIREQRDTARLLIRDYLEQGDADLALTVYRETVNDTGRWPLPATELRAMISALRKKNAWGELKPFLIDGVRRFPNAPDMKLLLASLFVGPEKRPAKAMDILEAIPVETLSERQEHARQKLMQKAQQMVQDGVLELDFGDEP